MVSALKAMQKEFKTDFAKLKQAVPICKAAAERFFSNKQDHYNYGYVLIRWGDGESAVEWIRQSARKNFAPALAELEEQCLSDVDAFFIYKKRGEHKPRYLERGKMFCSAAVESAPSNAVVSAYARSLAEGHEKELALKWNLEAARLGDAAAQLFVGNSLREKVRTSEDAAAVMEWFQKAANQGNRDAQFAIGTAFREGQLVEKDTEKAIVWLSQAAHNGHLGAAETVGAMLLNGSGDQQKAAFKINCLSISKRAITMFNCGFQNMYGIGTEINFDSAITHLNMAYAEKVCIAGYHEAKLYLHLAHTYQPHPTDFATGYSREAFAGRAREVGGRLSDPHNVCMAGTEVPKESVNKLIREISEKTASMATSIQTPKRQANPSGPTLSGTEVAVGLGALAIWAILNNSNSYTSKDGKTCRTVRDGGTPASDSGWGTCLHNQIKVGGWCYYVYEECD